jgi:hypothetical protein
VSTPWRSYRHRDQANLRKVSIMLYPFAPLAGHGTREHESLPLMRRVL